MSLALRLLNNRMRSNIVIIEKPTLADCLDFKELMFSIGMYRTVKEAKEILTSWLPDLKRHYENFLLPESEDYRSGKSTYGYNSDEQILERLDYISDRWNEAYKVRWLINLLDPNY